MRDLYNKYKLIIWLSFASITIIVTGIVIYNVLFFRIVSSSPANGGKVNIGQSAVIFNFNKDLEPIDKEAQITSPDKILLEAKVEGKKLIIYVNNIEKSHLYSITLKNIKSKSGDVISSYKISFEGQYLTIDQMSSEAQKVAEQQTDKVTSGIPEDPIMKILPKYTNDYSLNYIIYDQPSQKGKYIKIKAVLFVPDYEINNPKVILDYKNKALNYLRSNNINPNDYVIDWNPASAANL